MGSTLHAVASFSIPIIIPNPSAPPVVVQESPRYSIQALPLPPTPQITLNTNVACKHDVFSRLAVVMPTGVCCLGCLLHVCFSVMRTLAIHCPNAHHPNTLHPNTHHLQQHIPYNNTSPTANHMHVVLLPLVCCITPASPSNTIRQHHGVFAPCQHHHWRWSSGAGGRWRNSGVYHTIFHYMPCALPHCACVVASHACMHTPPIRLHIYAWLTIARLPSMHMSTHCIPPNTHAIPPNIHAIPLNTHAFPPTPMRFPWYTPLPPGPLRMSCVKTPTAASPASSYAFLGAALPSTHPSTCGCDATHAVLRLPLITSMQWSRLPSFSLWCCCPHP